MSMMRKFSRFVFGSDVQSRESLDGSAQQRQCRLERLEDRRVLSANPVVAGVTFFEADNGADLMPDYFEVTFQGGSETTRMTEFTINGDQDGNGVRSLGDIFFHSNASIPGAGDFQPFQFDGTRSIGVVESDILGWRVSDDGLMLEVSIKDFQAGDKLAFTIDTDEVESSRPDKIVSGTEIELSQFTAKFEDDHYTFDRLKLNGSQGESGGIFWDYYDDYFSAIATTNGVSLNLASDNASGHMDRTAAALDGYRLIEKPISVSGRVFHDMNLNHMQDGTEQGIAGVVLGLEKWNETTGAYEQVAEAKTNAQGDYLFGVDLGLTSGTYRIVETQPDGYLSVGAKPGTVAGMPSGSIDQSMTTEPNVLAGVMIPKGDMHAVNYDFYEVKPVELSGYVYHDRNDNGLMESGEEGLVNVQIMVRRTGGLQTTDVFGAWQDMLVTTDANGYYSVMGLPPGEYEVIEINQYPNGPNPLAGFLDGKDRVGTVDGVQQGTTGQDHHTGIVLQATQKSVMNNFGELRPVSLSGYVSVADRDGNCTRPGDLNYRGIENVSIELYNTQGQRVATTMTRSDGTFEFTGLYPGVYTLRQIQPSGYLDGAERPGSVDGVRTGFTSTNDIIQQIQLTSGQNGIEYGFCEHEPASVAGTVFHDRNNDGIMGAGEEGIAGVTIRLLHADGSPVMIDQNGMQMVMTAVTDAQGRYSFDNLASGEYQIQEIQPVGWTDGKETVGSLGGQAANDVFTKIMVRDGDSGVQYNFGEFKLSSISGYVHVDSDGNCMVDSPGDRPIAGVVMELVDQNGSVIEKTTTGRDGFYEFKSLLPGTYSVRQVQPTEYFSAGEKVGYLSGHPDVQPGSASANMISNIELKSNFNVIQYNFCERAGAAISGRVFQDGPAFETPDGIVPADYRSQRDGMFTPDDKPLSGVRMVLYWYVDPVAQAIAPRPVMLSEVLGHHYGHITTGPDSPVYVTTDAQGNYTFDGLQAGNYIVLQEQPQGFVDANNYVGSTTGMAFNSIDAATSAPQSLLSVFSQSQLMDSLANIRVNNSQVSVMNNFTEVLVNTTPPRTPDPEFPNIPELPPTNGNPTPPGVPLTGHGGLFGHQGISENVFVGIGFNGSMSTPVGAKALYSWHLSIINDGEPRDAGGMESAPWHEVGYLSEMDWNRYAMDRGQWVFTTSDDDGSYNISEVTSKFGTEVGFPLVGDFNGDGVDQIAIYRDGFWYLDANGNGQWDNQDTMARLGNADDQPVIGDWDGDGKDDIAIFGPRWEGDDQAIQREPGLPDRENQTATRPKNIPPTIEESVEGSRVIKSGVTGRNRADVIDHVFGFGEAGDIAISGDFNGDGITQIGVFNQGRWIIDSNGDGKLDREDQTFRFGESESRPVVGDFNGDGIDEVAVYTAGQWTIDLNNNRMVDALDRVFEMEGEGYPLAGDLNGDGIDTPILYRVDSNGIMNAY